MGTQIYHGDIVYAPDADHLAVHEDSCIVVEDGVIRTVCKEPGPEYASAAVTDYGRNLIIPAFSDLHVHGAQYVQRGIGMDFLLADWLDHYTFPQESRFADMDYARHSYDAFVEDMIKHGTFHANVFATIHRPATEYLFHLMEKRGMYGFVGKVNMDMNSPEYLCETTEESLHETEAYLENVGGCSLSSDPGSGTGRMQKVKPILAPRFAPTCSEKLMKGLGKLAGKYHCGVHTHLVESLWEAGAALECFPGYESDAQIYEQAGLMDHGPSIFAHVIFPTEQDRRIMKRHESIAVHCPDATTNIIAGIMPFDALEKDGVKIALGSDIAGGHGIAVYRQIARAIQLSKLKEFYEPQTALRGSCHLPGRTITLAQAFYHATKEAGAVFGKVGSLEPGYQFNALVIENMEDSWTTLTVEERLERFCYIGDDRSILERFIDGEKVECGE